MIRSFTRARSKSRPMLRAESHFPSLSGGINDKSPSVSMFTQDVPLAIMPIRARDAETYYAKIVGDSQNVERAIELLQSSARYDRGNVKELIADAITEIATSLAWYGRAPYEIASNEGDDPQEIRIASFTPRRLFVTPWFCLQVVPRAEWDRLKKTFIVIPRRYVWIVEMPRSLGGYRGYRKILRGLARFTASPANERLGLGTYFSPLVLLIVPRNIWSPEVIVDISCVHPEGRVAGASQLLSMARLDGIAGNALPVAYIPLGLVSLSAWRCRLETRKAASCGLVCSLAVFARELLRRLALPRLAVSLC
jgi:hypothetical protein